MFMHEIVIDEKDLKLQIQKVIMDNYNDLKNTQDVGYTSWIVAEKVVDKIEKSKEKRKNNLDYLKVEL